MSRQITKELALRIVKKLHAVPMNSGSAAHTLMGVFHNEVLIASFGIRHGSSKDQGHDHVQGSLMVSTRFAKELGICTKSQQQWIDEMINKGLIEAADPPE